MHMVSTDWLLKSESSNTCMDEGDFKPENPVTLRPAALTSSNSGDLKRRDSVASSFALAYRPSGDSTNSQIARQSVKASIARRRSDASSVPLRPDGVFKGLTFSLFGWSDARTEASLSYQLTSNGASIGNMNDPNHYACVCADGSRPTSSNIQLVSQRWVNECLASASLVDPRSKVQYSPSMCQLPILAVNKITLYISEKDQIKFDEIADIAKLCGFKCVSRNETRTPVSAITHFIFHDLVSVNRRRDLVPLARKNGKHVVSIDWLKDTMLLGQIQDESKYDISSLLEAPALANQPSCPSPKADDSGILRDVRIYIPAANMKVQSLVERLGGSITAEPHECSGTIRIDTSLSCNCETVREEWIYECVNQRRLVSRHSFIIHSDDTIDQLMLEKDPSPNITWERKQAAQIKSNNT